jgi:hypothetical protein
LEDDPMNRALYQAWQQARDTFLRYTNVIGVGRGPKIKGGREVAREAIVVLVDRKLRRANVPKGELIPATFGGFPTDVREPHLTVKRKRFDPNTPPDDPNDECLTDHEWIDWGKIHRLRLEQRRTGGRGTRSRTRGPKGATGDDPADAPTTEVVGNLFVIRDPTQTLVVTMGMTTTIDYIAAYNLLRGTFGDDYDFVSFYVDVGSGYLDVGNASNFVFNSTTGIGWGAVNNRPAWGSARLLRHIHHTWFSLRTLMHEPSHQWLFFVDYRLTPAGATQDLLHQDWAWAASQRGFHWGRWPDNDISSLDYDRADWIDNGDGTFNRTVHFETTPPDDVWFGFNSLDQYLMGLTPSSTVASVTIVQNPSPAQSDAFAGPYTPTPSTVTVGIDNIQYEEGARAPDYLNSQRVFHQAVVVITASTTSPLAFNTSSETWRTSYTNRYRAATSGRLMVDTSLLRANYSDLYVKDNAADAGGASSAGTFWVSPDLWVRNTDDNGTDHQCPIRGQPNWVYVRVRNKGPQPYDNVTVNAYLGNFASLTPGTEFFYPVDWNPAGLIGSATIATVPAAAGPVDGEAIAKITWPAAAIPPAAGWHPCLLAEAIPMETSPTGLHHVWDNKKLAQRNLTVIDPGDGCPPMADAGDLQAYAFASKFVIGHELRAARVGELRLQLEGRSEAVMLFLDPAGLVKGIEEHGAVVELPIPFKAGRPIPELESVQATPALPRDPLAGLREAAGRSGALSGSTLLVPAGTEFALLCGCDDELHAATTWIRFCHEARIQIGCRKPGALEQQYGLRGLQPVVVNGLPLLHVSDPREARITLRLRPGERATLQLIGVVSPYRGGQRTTCHITESVAGTIVGGLAVEIGS